MRTTRMRPAGAHNDLRWRRTLGEHLELRRITWLEYTMATWLCAQVDPRTGRVRTSWPVLAEQTGLTANHVETLCRGLRTKGYVAYLTHPGTRGMLVALAINQCPRAADASTDTTIADPSHPGHPVYSPGFTGLN